MESQNHTQIDTFDVLATAIQLAAQELADIHPQDEVLHGCDSVEIWKRYLLQQAFKKQQRMTQQKREVYRNEVLT